MAGRELGCGLGRDPPEGSRRAKPIRIVGDFGRAQPLLRSWIFAEARVIVPARADYG